MRYRQAMKHGYLYLSIAACGAAAVAIEIIGARILAPVCGMSISIWSTLITVTLAAMSIGCALGGRWADRKPSLVRFASLIIAAGIWIVLVPVFRAPFLAAASRCGARAAAVAASFMLFLVPFGILGTAIPFALRLRAQSLEEIGRAAGNLGAASALASVIAALCTGYVLIPNLGVSSITAAIGILLVLIGIPGLFRRWRGASL